VVSFTPRERAPGIYWIGGWVGPRAGLDDVEKRKFFTLPGLEFQPVAIRKTDYVILVPSLLVDVRKLHEFIEFLETNMINMMFQGNY
jgi:hypothetical protein